MARIPRTVLAAALAATGAWTPCALAAARFTSAPLSRSVRNESDAAIDRACAWLASLQSEDGSWCGDAAAGEGDAELTSIVLLALAGSGEELSDEGAEAVRAGAEWLKGHPCAGSGPAAAWRDIALAAFAPEAVRGATNALPYAPGVSTNGACAIRRRAAFLGIDDTAAATNSPFADDPVFRMLCNPGATAAVLPQEAAAWPCGPEAAERAWWFAHAVNLATGGSLYADGGGSLRAIDWRADFAGRCTTSQKIDGRGRGNWNGSPRETAFAVLLLKEL